MDDTRDPEYAVRLATLESKGWKKLFDVQAPYRRNLRKLNLGRTLDVGCGLGRNLINLENGVGVDHNSEAVKIARNRGLTAYSTGEWEDSGAAIPESFDSILLAHVLEHVSQQDSDEIISSYLPYLRKKGFQLIRHIFDGWTIRSCGLLACEMGFTKYATTHFRFQEPLESSSHTTSLCMWDNVTSRPKRHYAY